MIEMDIGWIDSWQLRDKKDVHPSHALQVVAVDDELKITISKMLLVLKTFTYEDTEGEKLLNEWEEYFKELSEKPTKVRK